MLVGEVVFGMFNEFWNSILKIAFVFFISFDVVASSETTCLLEVPSSGSPLGTHGLNNIGNTCYFNAMTQVLHASPCFREIISNISKKATGNAKFLSASINSLFEMMNVAGGAAISPRNEFLGIYKALLDYGIKEQQKMDGETLAIEEYKLFKWLLAKPNSQKDSPELKRWAEVKPETPTIDAKGIKQITICDEILFSEFMPLARQQDSGDLVNYILKALVQDKSNENYLDACMIQQRFIKEGSCGHKTETRRLDDRMAMLTIHFTKQNLAECLANYEKAEYDGVLKCDVCHKTGVTRQTLIEKWPNILIIRLDRGINIKKPPYIAKNISPINYPETLRYRD